MKPLLRRTTLVLGLIITAAVPASAQNAGVEVGLLTCESVPGSGLNLIITSSVDVLCEFKTPAGSEFYKGETGIGLGIDLNFGRDERMLFTVLAGARDIRPGSYMLEGKYGGGKASATVGVGAGASVLIGGGKDSITLQPLAVQGSTGLGVAAGVSYLYLERNPK